MADVVNFIILCHNREAKGTQRLFPHESGIPAEPWETASPSEDCMELGCWVSPHIHTKNTTRYKGSLWTVYLSCTWVDWIGIGDKNVLWMPLSQGTMGIMFFKVLEQFSLCCSNNSFSDFMPGSLCTSLLHVIERHISTPFLIFFLYLHLMNFIKNKPCTQFHMNICNIVCLGFVALTFAVFLAQFEKLDFKVESG